MSIYYFTRYESARKFADRHPTSFGVEKSGRAVKKWQVRLKRRGLRGK